MATRAYEIWNAAGRPYRRATWLIQIKALAAAHRVPFLGDLGNEAHLRASKPEDHTPFSATEWPVQIADYVINAIDLGAGPWGDRVLEDARAGRLPWLKYMNHKGKSYSRKRDNFQSAGKSGDYHLHLSGMSNHTWTGLNGYNPFVPPAPVSVTGKGTPREEDDDMKIILGNITGKATIWSGLRHSGWPLTAEGDEEAVNALATAGAVRITFKDAESLVNACGTIPDTTYAESVAAVKKAG